MVEKDGIQIRVIQKMMGVFLWSDASDRKAVIWCEDQGDLAYVNDRNGTLQAGDFFNAGDLVQFDMETCQSMRFANNPRLVLQKASTRLADALRAETDQNATSGLSENVIPFSPRSGARDDLAKAF
jgi:hypothetical protein